MIGSVMVWSWFEIPVNLSIIAVVSNLGSMSVVGSLNGEEHPETKKIRGRTEK